MLGNLVEQGRKLLSSQMQVGQRVAEQKSSSLTWSKECDLRVRSAPSFTKASLKTLVNSATEITSPAMIVYKVCEVSLATATNVQMLDDRVANDFNK